MKIQIQLSLAFIGGILCAFLLQQVSEGILEYSEAARFLDKGGSIDSSKLDRFYFLQWFIPLVGFVMGTYSGWSVGKLLIKLLPKNILSEN